MASANQHEAFIRAYTTRVHSLLKGHIMQTIFYADGSGGNSMSTDMGFQGMILIISNQGN